MSTVCPYCDGHVDRRAPSVEALLVAIASDDVDAAIELGLLRFELQPDIGAPCPRCRQLIDRLIAARDARRTALAARERYRQRDARLAQRAEARASRRANAPAPAADTSQQPALPAAAAAALARAKAKAAGHA